MKGTISEIWEVVDQMVEENIDTFLEDKVEEDIVEDNLKDIEEYDDDIGIDFNEIEKDEKFKTFDPVEENKEEWLQEFERILADYKLQPTYKIETIKRNSSSEALKAVLLVGGGIIILGLVAGGFMVNRNYCRRAVVQTLPVKEEPAVKEPVIETISAQPFPKRERMPWPFFYFR
ncbi:hypothetical protein Dred_1381 [Desulforamulus reducens MI-1]|uniref:Uncharacterized protein n=1 Tax=Desulforamulus reducens (strain ATCC BAA-1160 / DSM 100696 / MI-1) TaxID=349161 RepID=A4J4A8_DESRM|nr:hypothetical protein [Desulforamulus reducens]ABO49911.1 hypothetical protein Dred_1381 [Desulforamulus reducens MI-1]